MSKVINSICSLWRWLEHKSNLHNQFIRAAEQGSGAHYTSLKVMIREGNLISLKSLLHGASNIIISCNMTNSIYISTIKQNNIFVSTMDYTKGRLLPLGGIPSQYAERTKNLCKGNHGNRVINCGVPLL